MQILTVPLISNRLYLISSLWTLFNKTAIFLGPEGVPVKPTSYPTPSFQTLWQEFEAYTFFFLKLGTWPLGHMSTGLGLTERNLCWWGGRGSVGWTVTIIIHCIVNIFFSFHWYMTNNIRVLINYIVTETPVTTLYMHWSMCSSL